MIINSIKIQFLEQKDEVSIKYSLGYSPKKMVNQISRKFSISIAITIVICLLLLSVLQYYFAQAAIANNMLSSTIAVELWSAIVIIPLVVYFIVNSLIYNWLLKSWKF